jgi:uncharacterized membrane protein YeaQ/YmgE (transglycosylase-associated protein family)
MGLMNLLVILLAGAVIGGCAGLVLRSGGLALHMALGAAGAFLAGALGADALLAGVGVLTMAVCALGAVTLVAAAHLAMRSVRAGQAETARKRDSLS